MAVLSAAERDKLPDSAFAVPGKRALPIHDETHARLAWSQVDRTEGLSDEERATARRRIVAALKKFGVDTSEFTVREVCEPEAGGLAPVQEGLGSDGALRDVRVTLLREGRAASGRHYTAGALADVCRQGQGLKAFADHPTKIEDQIRPARSIRDIVGWYRDPSLVAGEDGRQQVDATLHVVESAEWLWQLIREAVAQGQLDLVGLSIDALVVQQPGEVGGKRAHVVEAVPVLKSCDVVTRASAGGALRHILEQAGRSGAELEGAGEHEADEASEVEGGTAMADNKEQVTAATTVATVTTVAASEGAGAGVAPVSAPVREDAREEPGVVAAQVAAAMAELTSVREAMAELRRERDLLASQRLLEERLGAVGLPAPIGEKLRKRFAGQVFAAAVLESALEEEVAALQALRDLGVVTGLVTGHGQARVMADARVRGLQLVQAGWDRLFGVQEALDPSRQVIEGVRVPQWYSLREAYVQTTGDAGVLGLVRPELSIAREANEVTTTVLNEVVLNAMTKRLVQDYQGQPQDWRRFCAVGSVSDFKRQDRILLNDFAALSTVAEGGAYTNLAWGDARESYTPAKRGNLVVVTRETILNDDLHAVRLIPTKLAIAAGITMNEFVFTTTIAGNPTMADGTKVYDDGVQTSHLNRGTAALASAALTAAITAMLKQTNSAGKRIGQRPRFLLVPPDLWSTANVLVGSTLVPGSTNNDVNVLRGALEPIIVPQLTDVNDYYLFADPAVMPGIEIGFVQGREVPELLLQDNPMDGQVFTNDQISYKVRWEFGGGWLDYRGTYWGNVA